MESRDEEKALSLNCNLHRRMSIRSSPTTSPRTNSPSDAIPWIVPTSHSPPKTIVLGLWPYADGQQIQYYVDGYGALYPDANLFLLPYSTSYDRRLGDALDALTGDPYTSTNRQASVLMHLFSGCGAAQGCRLLRAYRVRTGHRLPVKAVVMDSVPKLMIPSFRSARQSPFMILAFCYMLIMAMFFRVLSTVIYWHFDRRCRQNRDDLNNPYLLPPSAKKCYIFEEKDLMFAWHDGPKRDDDGCVREDINIKRTSIDEKGRWTVDQERYWQGIENVWEGQT